MQGVSKIKKKISKKLRNTLKSIKINNEKWGDLDNT